MSRFTNTQHLYDVMQELWTRIKADNNMSNRLLQSRLIVRFHYKDPDGWVTVDGSDGKEIRVSIGHNELIPDVEMFMKADVAHHFWLGKENPALALLTGKMQSKGQVNKALALLPVLKPAFEIYPEVLEDLEKSA